MKQIIILALTLLVSTSSYTQKVHQKTNVVLILIDDLSHLGVSAYGADRISSNQGIFTGVKIPTPHIDELANEGMICSQAYAYPLCEATRIALMSGKYNSRNFLLCKSQHASDITFGDVFQKAGYATGMFGKWKQTRGTKEIHGKDYIYEFGWDEFCCFDVLTEGQRFINPNLVINGEVKNYEGRTDLDPETGRRWYGPDICNRYALKFIDDNKNRPFFLYYPMLLVHDDHKPTPDTKPNEIFDNFDEANNNRNGHTGDDRRYFPDMIAYMDKLIGKVVEKIDEHGLHENTLIVIMGDNGTKECFTHVWPDGSEYPGRKGGTTDNGLHVPLVLNMPGHIKTAQGESLKQYDGLVDVTDIFPTICDAVGINIPYKDQLDGISFWPQATGETEEHRDVIYTWYNNNQAYTNEEELLIYAFNKDFKRYAPNTEYPGGRFFDFRTDPLEQAGDTYFERRFGIRLYRGLDLNKLTPEQEETYKFLGGVIDSYSYIPVEGLIIETGQTQCELGQSVQLAYSVLPENATRKNIIWESDNPKVASIDKFGILKAHQAGSVKITIYSWDDSFPVSANEKLSYSKTGISHSIEFTVK